MQILYLWVLTRTLPVGNLSPSTRHPPHSTPGTAGMEWEMVVINGDGSLGELLDMLASHPLDAAFEDCGNFCYEPRNCVATRDATGRLVYTDTDLIYPARPNTVRFWGNFLTHSHVFRIDTDDAEVIEVLSDAIAANMQRADYLAQIKGAA